MKEDIEIFFDLEETLINDFEEGFIRNLNPIKIFLENNNIKEINIFSFAIWNDDDLETFDKWHRKGIEDNFDIIIKDVFTVENIAKEILKLTGLSLEVTEVITMFGKEKSFMDFVKSKNFSKSVLVDDMIETGLFLRKNSCKFINVEDVQFSNINF